MADPRTAYQRGRIMAAISVEPLTAQQLANRLHLTKDAINIHLKAMKESSPRLIHVAGFAFNERGGRPAPQHLPGDSQDAVYVNSRTMALKGRADQVEDTLKRVAELLARSPMTASDLGDKLDLTASRARWYINKLRTAEPKRAYIKRHVSNVSAYPTPVYAIGNRPDATYTPKTRKTVYQEAMRDPERRKRIEHRMELRNLVQSKRKKPNGIFGALGL